MYNILNISDFFRMIWMQCNTDILLSRSTYANSSPARDISAVITAARCEYICGHIFYRAFTLADKKQERLCITSLSSLHNFLRLLLCS